ARYILDFDSECLSQHIYARESTLDQLAARKLAMYANLQPRWILPAVYQVGEPVIIETASIWWNIHIRDWQLANVPHEDILHIFPPDPLAEVPAYPQPTLGEKMEADLRAW